MIELTEILLGIGLEWLALAVGVLILHGLRPQRMLSTKAIMVLGALLLLIAVVGYGLVLVASGLGHSACGAKQTTATFPLLFVGLFAAPTVLLCIHRWYHVSRLRLLSVPDDPDAGRAFRLAATTTWITAIVSVGVVVALSGRAGFWPPVMYAVSRNFSEHQVRRLLELGFSPEAADVCGRKPVVLAALIRNRSLVKLLLDYGANPNQTNNEDNPPPPLWWAAHHGDLGTAQILIDKGADANGVGGRLPLMEASRRGDMEMVKLLMDKGAGVNSRNPHGTPLSSAAANNRIDVMRFLMELGADIEGKDLGRNWTPLMRAAAAGSFDAVK
ncbi:MAG: ankyrin repeat domain-containing protein, partial [Pseudomonadota bacterium]